MSALSTFFGRLFFALTCVLGWAVFPLLIGAGGIALLGYALIAELLSMTAGTSATACRDNPAARTTAARLGGPLRP